MSESKRDRVGRFIERAVRETMNEHAASNPGSAEWVKQNRRWFEIAVSSVVTSDPYRMKELADIMAWKGAPKV